jgi:DNA-binding protein Fis
MNKISRYFLAILLLLSLTACGTLTFDASSVDALEMSAKQMSATMSDEEKEKFRELLSDYYLNKFAGELNGASESQIDSMVLTELEGKTVDDFYEMINQNSKKM